MWVRIILLFMLIPIALADVNISIIPSAESVNYGEYITVNVSVDPNGQSVKGVQFFLQADNDKMKITNVTEGNFLKNNNATSYFSGKDVTYNNIIYSKLKYGYSGWIFGVTLGEYVTTSQPGNFSTITLRGTGAGESNISIYDVLVADGNARVLNYSVLVGTIKINVSQPGNKSFAWVNQTINTGREILIRKLYYVNPISGYTVEYDSVNQTNASVAIQPDTWIYSGTSIEKRRSW